MIKKFFELIKELQKTPRGKGILFFLGYFIFFIIIIIIFLFSERKPIGKYKYDYGVKYNFSLENIENNNYKYNYQLKLDNIFYNFVGQKNGYVELFTLNQKDYYNNNGNYFTLENNLWVKSNNPNDYSYFMEITNLKKILEEAYFLSKTDYDSGKEVFNFLISTNQIIKISQNKDIDIFDEANEIIVSTDEDGNVSEIKLKLNSYCQYIKSCLKELEIDLNYADFGNVSEIKSPI